MPRTLTPEEAEAVRAQLNSTAQRGSARFHGPVDRGELRQWALTMLGRIRAGSEVPSAVRHPLGFTCVQMYRGEGWGLCIHIWPKSATAPELTTSPVHSHSWDLFSEVIRGQLENAVVAVTDDPLSPTHRVMEITSAHGADTIRPTPRLVSCRCAAPVRVQAGERYRLPAGTFHLSMPRADGPTVTVLLAEDRYQAPEFALGWPDTTSHSVRRRRCLPGDLRRMASIAMRESQR